MKALWNNAVLADSDQTIVIEGNHYFPPDSVNRQYFERSDTHTFCPWKGQASYYCRACGTDLRPVRVSIERPDSITASAVSAREEIGRAVAQKIREVEDSRDLKRVAEDVLPQIEKFLESYEEKRLRRVRAGVVVAASGFGTCILGLIMSAVLRGPDAESALIVCGLGVIAFALGLGLVLNGLLFTT